MCTWRFGILGPLEVLADGRRLNLGGPTRRRLLAVLLLHAAEVVSVDRLLDAIWEAEPPPEARTTLRAHISKLRRVLAEADEDELLVTRRPGYSLQVAAEQVDAGRFEQLVAEGQAALDRGDAALAADTLHHALDLWRGEVLEDLERPRFAEAEAARLEELRVVALGARVDADLALGRHQELIGELELLVNAHPLREQLCGQLMLALYRSGRQADALAAYRDLQQRLDDQLGLEPAPQLAELETAILRHEPRLALSVLEGRSATNADGTTPASPPQARQDAFLSVLRRMPLVGRAAELGTLEQLWAAVVDGGRRVALVSGEAGVGKTRLVAELAAVTAAAEGAVVLVGRCEEDPLRPYQPLTDAMRGSAAATAALPRIPDALREPLRALLEGPAEPQQTDPSWLDDTDSRHSTLLDAVGQLLTQMAAGGPLLFVVDEAEHLDRASAHVLRHLARRLPERTMLVVCFRDPPGSLEVALRELLADLEGRGVADRVALRSLSERDLAGLVAEWTGAMPSAEFTHELWTSTGGNPFYAIEVVHDLAARGDIGSTDDAWRVPTGVRDVLRQRLHALSPTTREIVGCAAIVGREVDVALLTAIADQPGEHVTEALDEALRSGWLVETGRSWGPTYAFRHALMREAVHADIPAPQRRQLHLRAADALDSIGSAGVNDAAATAGHLRAAGLLADPQRTADVSMRAAEQAAAVYAWDEAAAHADAAVMILDHAGGPPSQRAQAATAAAEILIRSSIDVERAIDLLETALVLYREMEDRDAVARVHSRLGFVLSFHVLDIPRALEHLAAAEPALTDGVAGFDVQVGTALAASYALHIDRSRAAAQRALELAESLGRPGLVGWARLMQVCPQLSAGQVAAARTLTEQAWASARDLDELHLGWDTVLTGALTDSMFLLDPVAGQAWCRRGLAHPRLKAIEHARQAVTDMHAYALASMGALKAAHELAAGLPEVAMSRRLLLMLDGHWETAEQSWNVALEFDLDRGDRVHALLDACWLSQVLLLLGREVEASEALQGAVAIAIDGSVQFGELMVRAELARVLAARGDDEAGEHLAACDTILAGGQDWRGQVGKVELARGETAAWEGRHDAADSAFGRALEVFTTHHLPWWRAEVLIAWARSFERAGGAGEAEAKRIAAREQYRALKAQDRWHSRVTRPATFV